MPPPKGRGYGIWYSTLSMVFVYDIYIYICIYMLVYGIRYIVHGKRKFSKIRDPHLGPRIVGLVL